MKQLATNEGGKITYCLSVSMNFDWSTNTVAMQKNSADRNTDSFTEKTTSLCKVWIKWHWKYVFNINKSLVITYALCHPSGKKRLWKNPVRRIGGKLANHWNSYLGYSYILTGNFVYSTWRTLSQSKHLFHKHRYGSYHSVTERQIQTDTETDGQKIGSTLRSLTPMKDRKQTNK